MQLKNEIRSKVNSKALITLNKKHYSIFVPLTFQDHLNIKGYHGSSTKYIEDVFFIENLSLHGKGIQMFRLLFNVLLKVNVPSFASIMFIIQKVLYPQPYNVSLQTFSIQFPLEISVQTLKVLIKQSNLSQVRTKSLKLFISVFIRKSFHQIIKL